MKTLFPSKPDAPEHRDGLYRPSTALVVRSTRAQAQREDQEIPTLIHRRIVRARFGLLRAEIGETERGLLYRHGRFERVHTAGPVRLLDPLGAYTLRVHGLVSLQYRGGDDDAIVQRLGAHLPEHFLLADTGIDEVGLLSIGGKLEVVIPPGSRHLYWKRSQPMQFERLALSVDRAVPAHLITRLRQLDLRERIALIEQIPDQSVGLLIVHSQRVGRLGPGLHAYWNFHNEVRIELIDLRLRSVEVSGQELLTRDRVSLRINLSASLRVLDPEAAVSRVVRYEDHFYRELQFGLRKVVAMRKLDELLTDKAGLDAEIFSAVRSRLSEIGVELNGIGIKDVILPGEMREILNGVVLAEKQAEAQVIRRREESNALRSALNTAKLIDEHPTLLRLKEIETVEKITEKVGSLTVFGGLEGVMNQLVRLRATGG